MKQFTKRCLAIVLSFAMSFTLLPSAANMVFAEEMISEEGLQRTESEAADANDNLAGAINSQADAEMIDSQAATETVAASPKAALTPRAAYTFEEADLEDKTINDTTGNGYHATLKGEGAAIADGMLTLPGGAAGSKAAYVELPGTIFEGQDALTINAWVKNLTGVGNYAAMYFGTKTKHVDSSVSNDLPLNYWIFNPMEPDTKKNQFKSVWTNDNNADAPYNTEVGPGKGSAESVTTDDKWRMYTTVITADSIATYYDGEFVNSVEKTKTTTDFGTGLVAYIGRSAYNDKFFKGGVHSVSIYNSELSANDITQLYQDTKLDVALRSVNIVGENSLFAGKTLQLSATLVPDYASVEDASVTWNSDNPAVATIDNTGKVTAVSSGDAKITATIAGVVSAPFTIHVIEETTSLAPNKKYLTVYTTTKKFYTDGAWNIDQETESVYMAVSDDGYTFHVLNNGGGVIFSKNAEGTLKIRNPRVYLDNANAAAPFTVVAQDSKAANGFHVFTSADGVHYYDDTLVPATELFSSPLNKNNFELLLGDENLLETDSSISLGNAVELSDAQYKKIVDSLGTVTNTGLESLKGLKITSAQGAQVTTGMLNEMYPSVNATYTDGSSQNFKIDWTDALENANLSTAGTHTLTGKVVQPQYINNLKELNGSTLKDDDPANANPNFPDNYDPVTKKVYYDKTKFIEGMADPNIYWDEQTGYYYMTASYFPEDGDQIDTNDKTEQYDRVVMRRGRTLEELQTRKDKQVTVWKVGNQGYDDNGKQVNRGYRFIWAPELHRVGDYWVVYFTESQSSSNAYGIYSHALILDGDKDPYETALTASNQASEWKDYKMRKDESLAAGVTDPFGEVFCLDMTYFKDEKNGQSYVLWAGKPTASFGGDSTDIFIATVDEHEPWKITSAATRLTCSDYGWERIRYCVNEGPTVLQHDGNIFMCYSAGGTGSEYAIGMCSAKNGENLLDINNWKKSPYPLLTSRDVHGEEGPGHNSFTVDKDGNNIFVYHARPTSHNYQMCGKYNGQPLSDPCRHARLKRVHWAADGTPILKMTYENELLEEYETVSLTVNVIADGSGSDMTDLPKPVTDITLDKNTIEMEAGESETLTATIAPTDASNKNLTWSVVSAGIVEIQGSGTSVTLVGKKAGTTTVRATAASGVYKECEVTVKGVPVTAMELDKDSLTLTAGTSATLKPIFAPENATNKKVTWTSSAPNIATVKGGVVTGRAEGEATITATSVDGGFTQTCEVLVEPAVVTDITLSQTSLTLAVNEKSALTATVNPLGYVSQEVSWSSSDATIASVDENGNITALKGGPATITATSKEDSTVKATCMVTVIVPVESITLNKTSLSLNAGSSETLTITLNPANATYNVATWTSSNSSVATVDQNGKVTGVKAGNAVITATAGGKSATCQITVTGTQKVSVTGIKLSGDKKLKIAAGKKVTLTATIQPENATNKNVTWNVSNSKYAKMTGSGNKRTITLNKKGGGKKVTVTATAADGSNKKASVTITIMKGSVKKISFKPKSRTLKAGKKVTLKPTISVNGKKKQTNTKLSWKSSNTKYATVNGSGKVTTKKAGKGKTVTITATSTDGTNKKATVKIKIK